jgi:hypothetical protein
MASAAPIKNIIVLGATGNIGIPIVKALVNHPARYNVTAVTRDKAKASPFPMQATVEESDLSDDSLRSIFLGQDAIVSCVATPLLLRQKAIIDIAIESGVRRFLPSEFGMDSGNPNASIYLPVVGQKNQVTDYLKAKEDKISWTAVIVGAFFDWSLRMQNPLGWNIPEAKAMVYDTGDYEYEATNLDKIGEAVAAILAPEHERKTTNEYVYVNSFTITQNQVLAALEEASGKKFDVTKDTSQGTRERALEIQKKEPGSGLAVFMLIVASFFGQGAINEYSKNTTSGLWNDRLGLREESLEETVRNEVARWK